MTKYLGTTLPINETSRTRIISVHNSAVNSTVSTQLDWNNQEQVAINEYTEPHNKRLTSKNATAKGTLKTYKG